MSKSDATKNNYYEKKDSNVIPVSFKNNAYEQKLKADIMVESANVGFSTWVKHVCAVYLYSGNSDKIDVFSSKGISNSKPEDTNKNITSGINLDL